MEIVSGSSLADCEYHIVDPGARINATDLIAYYNLLRDYVRHEDDLINSRLTWSLTVDGFLFAAYGLLVGKAVDVLIELHKPETQGAAAIAAALWLSIALCVLGILVIVAVGISINFYSRGAIAAAHNSIQHLFTIAHKGPLRLAAEDELVGEALLLPKIISGGARAYDHTSAASAYYLRLPMQLMWGWVIIGVVSVVVMAAVFCPMIRH